MPKRNVHAETAWSDDSSVQLCIGLVDRNPGPRTEAEQREAAERLREQIAQVLEQLTTAEREILCMRIYDELEHSEIAEILEISVETARKRFSRAKVEFQDDWLQLFDAPWTES